MLDLEKAEIIANKKQSYYKKVYVIKKYLVEEKGVAPEVASKIAKDLINEKEGVRLDRDAEYMEHAHEEMYGDCKPDEDELFWEQMGVPEHAELDACFKRMNDI